MKQSDFDAMFNKMLKVMWAAVLVYTVSMLALVFTCNTADAQTFPSYFEGDHIPDGTWEAEVWPYDAINAPISMPPNDSYYYEVVLTSEGDTIHVEASCLARLGDGCISSAPTLLEFTGDFYWNEAWTSYARAWSRPEIPDILWFEAWNFKLMAMEPVVTHSGGCLKAQPNCCPWYDFDQQCVVWVSKMFFPVPPYEKFEGQQVLTERE